MLLGKVYYCSRFATIKFQKCNAEGITLELKLHKLRIWIFLHRTLRYQN